MLLMIDMPFKDPIKAKEYFKQYHLKHRIEKIARAEQWIKDNRERYNRHQTENAKKHGYKFQRNYSKKKRLLCLIHYGGNPPKCACPNCNESHIEFLTIDHNGIKPDEEYRSGDNLYGWLIKNNFPEGFRVLCMNCNHFIGHHGWCPHEQERK